VIASLWSVDDDATRELMTRFYRNVMAHMSRAEALAAAQEAVRALPEFSDPHFWAAFVLSGEDGPVVR
jgi:CHAT domain-containing protein